MNPDIGKIYCYITCLKVYRIMCLYAILSYIKKVNNGNEPETAEEQTYLLDMPHGFQWKGVYVDAALRTVQPVPAVSTVQTVNRQKTFMQLSALQGSILENRIFEDDFKVESISTAKLFQICNQQNSSQPSALGCQLMTIDKTNINTLLPTLSADENIKEDIQNSINQNLIIRIPSANGLPLTAMSYKDWTGIGYIKENPDTGEAGYMLSGIIAGGMTAVSPDKWASQYLVEILGRPYAGEYRTFEITYPKNESIIFTPAITVKGIVLDTNAKVLVNETEAQVEGNAFTATVNLTKGINKITATATASSGVTLSDSVTVKYRILLRTYITFPYEGADLSTTPIDVEGIVSDPEATIEVNGINATISPDGRFIAQGITLSEGANMITVKATNPEGDTDTQTITINYKANPLSLPILISITSPTDNETISKPSVMVRGTVTTNAEEVWIKVNGVLAEIYNGQFTANQVPLTQGDNRIIVNATDSNGGVGRAEVTVKVNTTVPYVTLNANITSGIPPLTAYFTVTTEIPNAVTSYQIDFEGDGTVDYTGTTFEDISHTYLSEGIYNPIVTVIDDKGNMYTDSIAIMVLNKTAIDTLLKGKWEKMKEALSNGEIHKALQYFADRSKNMYEYNFNLMAQYLGQIVQEMGTIAMNTLRNNVAEYEMIAMQNGTEASFFIVFIKDPNGLWKIIFF